MHSPTIMVSSGAGQSNAVTPMCRPPFRVSVRPSGKLSGARLSFAIDTPVDGHVAATWSIEFSGFVLPWASIEDRKPLRLQFTIGGVEYWSTPIDLPRPDLKSHPKFTQGQISCGYSTVLPSFLHNTCKEVEIWLHEERPGPIVWPIHLATIEFEKTSLSGTHEGSIQRIDDIALLHLTSIGRSGSSLLSKMLSLCDEIFVPKMFGQYGETSVISHFLRLVAVLSSEGCYGALNHFENSSDTLSLPSGYWRFDEGQMAIDLAKHLHETVTSSTLKLASDVTAACARAARTAKPRARYWLEKNWNNLSAALAPSIFATYREIVLVRSLPSFWQSQFAFSKKIMTPDRFAPPNAKDTLDKYLNLARTALDPGRGALVLKYEDLIASPGEQMSLIGSYLNVAWASDRLEEVLAVMNARDEFRSMLSTSGDPGVQNVAAPSLNEAIAALDEGYRNYLRDQIVLLGYDAFF